MLDPMEIMCNGMQQFVDSIHMYLGNDDVNKLIAPGS